jgi:hypothetical protein
VKVIIQLRLQPLDALLIELSQGQTWATGAQYSTLLNFKLTFIQENILNYSADFENAPQSSDSFHFQQTSKIGTQEVPVLTGIQ